MACWRIPSGPGEAQFSLSHYGFNVDAICDFDTMRIVSKRANNSVFIVS